MPSQAFNSYLSPWLITTITVMAIIFSAIHLFYKIRLARIRFSTQQSLRLYQQNKSKALGKQIAAANMFGIVIHEDILEMAEDRENPLGFLNSYKQASPYLKSDNREFVPRSDKFRLITRARMAMTLAIVPTSVCWSLLIFSKLLNISGLPLAFIAMTLTVFLAITPMLVIFSFRLNEAHRLYEELDKWHPPVKIKISRLSAEKAPQTLQPPKPATSRTRKPKDSPKS